MQNLKYPLGKFDPLDSQWNIEQSENIDYIANYPSQLKTTINKLSKAQLQTPYRPGGWTVIQLVHHIADSHMNAYIRFKLALTANDPTIKPYAESEWAKLPDYNLEMLDMSLQLLQALHAKWSNLMHAMTESDWSKRYHHPKDDDYVELEVARRMYHWHSAHHLAHITSLIVRENR